VRRALELRRRSDLLIAIVDICSAAFACWLAFVLRFESHVPLPARYTARYVGASIGVCVACVVAGRAAGLYRRAALRPGTSNVEPALESAVVLGAALLVIDVIALSGDVSRAWIGLVTLFLILFGIGTRAVLAHSRRALVPFGIGLERYALVGDDASGRRLLDDLTRAPGAPFVVVEVFARALSPEELVGRAAALHLDGLILPADIDAELAGRLATALSGAGIDVLLAPGLGGLDLRVASIAMLHGVPLLRTAGLSPRRPAVRTTPRRRGFHGVAIMGTRGIPANYGGFETFAERLALHLVAQGVPVTVYCRRHHATQGHEWRGVRLVTLPSIRHKYLDTVVHSVLSALHLVVRTRIRDVVLCNAANAPVLPFLRTAGRRVVMNVDGLEWRRGKWGMAGRSWYRLGEWLSVRSSSVLVTDAAEVRTYYRVRHDTDSVMIPYGADLLERGLELPAELGVTPDGYVLYVSRWEQENNPLLVASAHADSGVRAPARHVGTGDVRRCPRACGPGCGCTPRRAARAVVRVGVHRTAEQRPLLRPRHGGRWDPSRADRGDGGRQPLPRARHPGEPRGRRARRVVLRRRPRACDPAPGGRGAAGPRAGPAPRGQSCPGRGAVLLVLRR
jgi:hypothetical protein